MGNNYFCPLYGELFINKLYHIDPDPNAMAWFVANVAPVALSSFSDELKAILTNRSYHIFYAF